MKFLIAISCILAVASAGYITPVHQNAVTGTHGVPLQSTKIGAARTFHHIANTQTTSLHQQAVSHAAPSSNGIYEGSGKNNNAQINHASTHAAHTESIRPWIGPQHISVIGHNGVPTDTHENSARRALHHAAYAEAISRNVNAKAAHYIGAEESSAHVRPIAHGKNIHQWTGPQHLPVIGHNGVPVDTHENNARRDFHHAAYAEAITRNGAHNNDHDDDQGYDVQRHAAQGYAAHGYAPSGYVDQGHAAQVYAAQGQVAQGHAAQGHAAQGHTTNEYTVQEYAAQGHAAQGYAIQGHAAQGHAAQGYAIQGHAAQRHAAQGHAAQGHAAQAYTTNEYTAQGHTTNEYTAQGYAAHSTPIAHSDQVKEVHQWTGPQHIPVIGHNGVPVDTDENNARRAFHHAAYAEALARNGPHTKDNDDTQEYATEGNNAQGYAAHATPVANDDHVEEVRQWTGPQHNSAICHNVALVDTDENNAARGYHHASNAESMSRNDHDDKRKKRNHYHKRIIWKRICV